jgi:hypothetical protein
MSKIPARMVELDNGDIPVSLDKLFMSSETIPIDVWGKPTHTNVEKAIEYLRSIGGGCVKIPANERYNFLLIRVMWGKDRSLQTPGMQVRYEYMDWRPPNNVKDENNNIVGEYRPYSDKEPWQAGDIIHNSDMEHSDDKVTEWYCVVSGNSQEPAGTWKYVNATVQAGKNKFTYNPDEEKLTLI